MAKNSTSFKKGTSGNPKGKPKGAKNRTTDEIREFIKRMVDNNLETIESDLERVTPLQRAIILEKLIKYFLPALSKNDNTNEETGKIEVVISYKDENDNANQ